MGPNFLRHQPVQNQILAALPEAEMEQLRPHLTAVRLVPGQILIDHNQTTEHVFFVEEGIVSIIDGDGVQVAMVGRDGLVGCPALLGIVSGAFVASVVQIPGPTLRIPVAELQRILVSCPTLQRLCMGTIATLMEQSMQTAASNACNTLTERCIRWLLMAHDRIDGDDLPITHEALADMLSVRRSGVTVAILGLQDAGIVRVARGRTTILDRIALEHAARTTRWTVGSNAFQQSVSEQPLEASLRTVTAQSCADGAPVWQAAAA
jgi:CRP-like cAMP-binding protein